MSALLHDARAGAQLPPPNLARSIRMAAGLTQQRIADELHVHVVTVARWESGARRPRGVKRTEYAHLLRQLGEVVL